MESFYDLYVEEVAKSEKLSHELKHAKIENTSLTNRIKYLENTLESSVEKAVNSAIAQVSDIYEEKIAKLNYKIVHLESLLNLDSDNSGIPTSMTPLNKDKKIPNTRTATDKKIGGQSGHHKHKLERFADDEVNTTVNHRMRTCNICGGKLTELGIIASKDEIDFEVVVKKIRHHFYQYRCEDCGEIVKTQIPLHLKEENQYGERVQALAITLMNQGFVSMSRTKEIIYGLSGQEIDLSVGYIAKLQNRLAGKLDGFMRELKHEIISLSVLHWDDTVIMINKKRACLRFYGTDKYAYYSAHEKKDKEGLDKDGILMLLSEETVVVHDHAIVNYNDDYVFQNAECCVHLLRDLQKVKDNLQHEWADNMQKLITDSYKKRKTLLGLDVSQVMIDYDKEIALGRIENLEAKERYYADTENALLNRLERYKENYLMWAVNEEIPFTNNEAERSLRSAKTKMKVSGQFQNIRNAEYFAIIKSYIETGKRHGINTQSLIIRALEGNYYTLAEMKSQAE